MHQLGMIELTVREQQRAKYWHRSSRDRVTPRRLLRESDELMFWLEECLLQRLRIVPGWLMPRLVQILASAGGAPALRIRLDLLIFHSN